MLDGEKIPVIFLDGFDELLQASGVAQSDYLERVAEFQLREAEFGRGAVILITSRTVVIDQTRIPDDSLVLRLEDFDDKQIDAWLETWNTSNSDRAFSSASTSRAARSRRILDVPRVSARRGSPAHGSGCENSMDQVRKASGNAGSFHSPPGWEQVLRRSCSRLH
jgi:hypothetical protein